ncbi:MAG: phosphate transport system ATP-binding protein, partial [Pirellulaceae bacterium]
MTPHVEYRNVTVRYGNHVALDDISLSILPKTIFGIIGPANSGKTTFLKCINRTIDFIDSAKVAGDVLVQDESVAR